MKQSKRRTLREMADAFAKDNRCFCEYDADGYRRVHASEELANDSGCWLAGYRAQRDRRARR